MNGADNYEMEFEDFLDQEEGIFLELDKKLSQYDTGRGDHGLVEDNVSTELLALQTQLEQLKHEKEAALRERDQLAQQILTKDGEIQIVRTNLSKMEQENMNLKDQIVTLNDVCTKEREKAFKTLEQERDRLQTYLIFQEQETKAKGVPVLEIQMNKPSTAAQPTLSTVSTQTAHESNDKALLVDCIALPAIARKQKRISTSFVVHKSSTRKYDLMAKHSGLCHLCALPLEVLESVLACNDAKLIPDIVDWIRWAFLAKHVFVYQRLSGQPLFTHFLKKLYTVSDPISILKILDLLIMTLRHAGSAQYNWHDLVSWSLPCILWTLYNHTSRTLNPYTTIIVGKCCFCIWYLYRGLASRTLWNRALGSLKMRNGHDKRLEVPLCAIYKPVLASAMALTKSMGTTQDKLNELLNALDE